MNFNLHQNEYDLAGSQTQELIKLYGCCIKLLITQKINQEFIFGDFSHIKVDNKACYELYAMPENSEDFEQYERLQSQFGVPMDTSINLYISKISVFDLINPSENAINEYDVTIQDSRIKDLLGSLIIVPSGKILEVTNIVLDCFGLNNVFLYNQLKNVYKFQCKTYVHKNADEIETDNIIRDKDLNEKQGENLDMLNEINTYFDTLKEISEKQKNETDKYVQKNDDVFGRF